MARMQQRNVFRHSIMTPLGLVEGDCLNAIETRKLSRLKDLVKDSDWPDQWVLMGIGSLIRSRLISAILQGSEIYLFSNAPAKERCEEPLPV